MSLFRPALSVAVADFRERSRSSKLLVVPVLIAYFAKAVAVDSTLVVGGQYTGIPTAAWYGGMVMGIGTTVLLFVGFPLVKGSLARDRQTSIMELVGTSPISSSQYLFGKWLSNVAVLAIATGVLALATTVAFLAGGTGPFNVIALWTPFVLVTLPSMGLVSAVAVCFETIKPLRGTAGTALYFVTAIGAISVSLLGDTPVDITGIAILRNSMETAIATQYPTFEGPIRSFAYTSAEGAVETFRWAGLGVTLRTLGSRLPIVALSASLLGVATITFDRVAESPGWLQTRFARWRADDSDTNGSPETPQASQPHTPAEPVTLAPAKTQRFGVTQMLAAEFRMAVRGQRRLWYLGCLVGFVATAVAPLNALGTLVVPIVLLSMLPIWSALGVREQFHQTGELVFVASNPLRLLSVSYLVSAAIGAGLVLPAFVRFALGGQLHTLFGGLVAVLCLPAVALAAGVWSGKPAVFEVGYLTAWYLGPMNGVEPLDYLGANPATPSIISIGYLVLTVLAFGIAIVGHRQRIIVV